MVKVVAHAASDRFLGVHVVAENVGDAKYAGLLAVSSLQDAPPTGSPNPPLTVPAISVASFRPDSLPGSLKIRQGGDFVSKPPPCLLQGLYLGMAARALKAGRAAQSGRNTAKARRASESAGSAALP